MSGRGSKAIYDRQVEDGTRLRCVVPNCNHTQSARGNTEFICYRHWGLIDGEFRRFYSTLKRRITVNGPSPKLLNMWWRHWQRMKRQAMERAAGI